MAAGRLSSSWTEPRPPGRPCSSTTVAIATIAEITRRLDGLPLAIELAAARVAVLDLGSILARLADRFAFLTGGSRTAPARQQTLRAAVAWSYDLLTAREQRLFCRLSVFSGGFSLDAALALAGPAPEEAPEDLFSLVSKSMVATVGDGSGPTRYYLHESLRQFGAAQLGESGTAQALDAHADYYLALVRSAGREPFGRAMTPWLKSVELELHNVRAVFSYLLSRPERRDDLLGALVTMRRYWDIYDRGREGFDLLERSLAGAGPSDDPVLRAKALVAAADVASHLDASVSARYAKAGGELALDLGDRGTAALAAALIASVNGLAGRYNEAEGERALRLARQVAEPWLVCEGLIALGLSVDVRSRPGVERARAPWRSCWPRPKRAGTSTSSTPRTTTCARTVSFTTTPEPFVHMSRGWRYWQMSLGCQECGRTYGVASSSTPKVTTLARSRRTAASSSRLGAGTFLAAWLTQQRVLLPVFLRSGKTRRPSPACTASQPNSWGQQASGSATRVTGGLTGTWMCCAARLGDRLAYLLAEGAAMTREEVTEMLAG